MASLINKLKWWKTLPEVQGHCICLHSSFSHPNQHKRRPEINFNNNFCVPWANQKLIPSIYRSFIRELRWKQDSLSYRLATRANKEINELVIAKSKKGLKNKFKNKILLTEYVGECRIRNCFICSNRWITINRSH